MKTLVLASGNKHKIVEFNQILTGYKILSLKDIGFDEDIDETGETLEENSKIKAATIFEFCKQKGLDYAVIADDSGLFVNALNGEPGVHSARYSGDHNDEGNRQKLLKNLQGKSDRSAYFACCICYKDEDDTQFFIGKTYGNITNEKRGSDAFGYDPLFESIDLGKTFGEASAEEKDSVSHRGRAIEKLQAWLNEKK